MIKSNELRLGNYVTNKLGTICIITQVGSATNTEYIGGRCIKNNYWYNYFNPIPLTEEILLKCGFEKKKWDDQNLIIQATYYRLGNIIIYLLRDSFEVELIVGENEEQFNLFVNFKKKLHILQNVVFTLTGQELEVNL